MPRNRNMNAYLHQRALRAVFVVLMLVLPACSPLVLVNAVVPDEGFQEKTDIPYGSEPRQRLDLYKPAVLKSGTVVVFLYGGSWKRGKRSHYRFVGQAFADRGFITVVPDYRVYPDVEFPRFVEDAAKAVRWVQENIKKSGGNPKRIVLIGHSAGAHIAAYLALDTRYLDKAGVPSRSIAGVVGLAGPYAFNPLEFWTIRPIFENAPNRKDIRPINFVRKNAPPMLLFHGEDDTLVYPENSQKLAKRLRQAGANAKYVSFAETGHLSILLAMAKPFQDMLPVMDQAVEFIDRLETSDGRVAFSTLESNITRGDVAEFGIDKR